MSPNLTNFSISTVIRKNKAFKYKCVVSTTYLIKLKYFKVTRTLTKIPPHVSFRLRYLFQDKGVRGKELLTLYPEYSRTSLYRHAAKSMNST